MYKNIKEDSLYLCPKDSKGQANSEDPTGGGGNGRFSYTMNGVIGFQNPEKLGSFRYVEDFEVKAGALEPKRTSIKAGTQVIWPGDRMITFIEEHPWNNTNHGWVGDSWAADSYLALRHDPQKTGGRGNFAFLDGHAETRRYPYYVIKQGGRREEGIVKFQGVDLLNEFQFPYAYDSNAGGVANTQAFLHKFAYPYR